MRVIDAVSILTAIFENLFFAGIIYGWPSLQYVLMQEGYFQEQCHSTNNRTVQNKTGFQELKFCPEMMNMFNLAFTLATACQNVSALIFGFIIDRYGTWMMRSIATGLYSLAFVLFSTLTAQTSWLLFPASICLAVGGLQMLVSNLQLGNLSKSCKSIIITLMTGSFDSSALTFLLIKILAENHVNLRMIMVVMACLTIVPWLRTFLLMPKKTIPSPKPRDYRYGMWTVCRGKIPKDLPDKCSTYKHALTTTDDIQNEEGLKACLQNKLFWSNLFYFCVGNLQFTFFIGSFVSWLETIFAKDEEISYYTTLLGFLLLGGAVVSPLNGALTDAVIKYKKKHSLEIAVFHGLLASTATTSIFSVLLSISVLISNVHTSVIFALLFRSFLYSGVGNFIAQTFPSQHFGKLYGLSATAAGLTSFLQYALFNINSRFDPTFTAVYSILLCCNVLVLIHPLSIGINLLKQRNCDKN